MRDLPISQSKADQRLPHLDSVRGIAAFVVVFHHALLSLPSGHTVIERFDGLAGLSIVSLGRPAVILFFVLSGFVLTRGLQVRPQDFILFAARRILRLMPTYWAAIALSVGACCLVPRHTAGNMSAWFNGQWGSGLSISDVWRHLVMLSCGGQYPLDHVAWSLVHELRLSICLPIFVFVCRRGFLLPCLAVAGFGTLGAEVYIAAHPAKFPLGLNGYLFDAPDLGASLVLTIRLGLYFAIGSGLAMRWDRIATCVSPHHRFFTPVLVVSVVLLSIPMEIAMAIGAALLIVAVTSSRQAASCLSIAPLEWLGRVSYSLYLIHLPIMLSCGLWLDAIVPPWVALAVAGVVSLPAAEVLYRLVEAPSIRWSRELGRPSRKIAKLAPVLAAA